MSGQKKIVSLVRCESYDREKISEAVNTSIRLIGGLNGLISTGQKILVKPNLLRASPVDRAITTHPEVVRAVCEALLRHGCEVIIADSPGGGTPYTERALRRSYEKAGLDVVAKQLGIELNFDLTYRTVPLPSGKMIKRFAIIRPALDADAIVNVPKLKTHLFTYFTGATKNTFGLIPGIEKATFHSRLSDARDFSEMLVDLNELVRPRLNVMDAVIGMEGNGPNAGKPRKIGAVLTSTDHLALDVVACRLVSIHPLDVGVVKAAIGRGLLKEDLSDVWVTGENIEEMIIADFEKPKSYLGEEKEQSVIWRALGRMSRAYALRPVMLRNKCRGIKACGECMRACPRTAISEKEGFPKVDYGKCIRCYCCHEICPNDAVALKRSASGSIIKSLIDRKTEEDRTAGQ